MADTKSDSWRYSATIGARLPQTPWFNQGAILTGDPEIDPWQICFKNKRAHNTSGGGTLYILFFLPLLTSDNRWRLATDLKYLNRFLKEVEFNTHTDYPVLCSFNWKSTVLLWMSTTRGSESADRTATLKALAQANNNLGFKRPESWLWPWSNPS